MPALVKARRRALHLGHGSGEKADLNALRHWLIEKALPVWATHGFDVGTQRFQERLDKAARPIAVPQRAMVQARQIYVYAQAAMLGWHPEGAALAESAMAALRRDYLEMSNGRASVVFSVHPASGAPVSRVRDAYTHAFVLFALAQLHAMNGDAELLTLADMIIAYVDEELTDAVHGGVFDASPRTGAKRQNPHMHLLEAYLALDTAAPGRGYIERAHRLVQLFHDRLAHLEHEILLEHFADDWGNHPDKAMLFEPGHHYEWAWLLHRHQKLGGADHAAWRERLHRTATEFGRSDNGLLWDEVGADRRVLKRSTRLWPHTEAIKAASVRHTDGDAEAAAFAQHMSDLLFAHFLDLPFEGGWTDHLASDLAPLVDYVPASSLYHLMHAASEAEIAFPRRVQEDASPLIHV